MRNIGKLKGYTVFITGGSRGIGKAVALKLAKDGANVALAAKTAESHPKLPGTIYTAAKEVEDAGGKALPCIVDVRSEEHIQSAVDKVVDHFGGIDILINNASAISLTKTPATTTKKFDLMHQVVARGTFLCSRICLPHLIQSQKNGKEPHILNMSPPLRIEPARLSKNIAYTIAKYGMSMCTIGMADEFKGHGIAVNSLWPRTFIWTSVIENLGGKHLKPACRSPEIVSDASYAILIRRPSECSGNCYFDDDVLREEGIIDPSRYDMDSQYSAADLMVEDRWRSLGKGPS